MKIKISPSILSADFCNLESEIAKATTADMLHLDVMDGHFVPNISFGLPVLSSIRCHTDMFLDVHLMVSRPADFVDSFIKAGADLICFHIESDCNSAERLIDNIHAQGKAASIAIRPSTPVAAIAHLVAKLDMVLIMTVEPGFGGQKIILDTLPKIHELRTLANKVNPTLDIEVDGGINHHTAKLAVEQGANVLVAGSLIFLSDNPKSEIAFLKRV